MVIAAGWSILRIEGQTEEPERLVVTRSGSAIEVLRALDHLTALAAPAGWLFVGLELTPPSGQLKAASVTLVPSHGLVMSRVRRRATREGTGAPRGRKPKITGATLDRIVAEVSEGWSYYQIARGLEADGITPPGGGGSWSPASVRAAHDRSRRVATD
jgi:hypothetical protein